MTASARIGILTVSDRAFQGVYEDEGGPAIEAWLGAVLISDWSPVRRIVPDGVDAVASAIVSLADAEQCDLILTTGGTGPALRDQTPEGVRRVTDRELDGFGEEMRRASLAEVPTAILSRQMAAIRGRTLVITLPGKPSAIATCLKAVFAAVPYCLDLIGAGRIETDPGKITAFRPKQGKST